MRGMKNIKFALKYMKISLCTQWSHTCFGQPCGHLQGYHTKFKLR